MRTTAVFATFAGGLVAYSAVKNKGVSETFRAFLMGNDPANIPSRPGYIPAQTVDTNGVLGANVVTAAAQSQLGKPYVWDTPLNFSDPNPSSFDCSGLTGWCYLKAGVKLGHYTGTQRMQLKRRPYAAALPGDLIFFGLPVPYHVAVYMGANQIIEAPDVGIPVRYRTLTGNESGISVGAFPGIVPPVQTLGGSGRMGIQ